jgi:hypothetical protein
MNEGRAGSAFLARCGARGVPSAPVTLFLLASGVLAAGGAAALASSRWPEASRWIGGGSAALGSPHGLSAALGALALFPFLRP